MSIRMLSVAMCVTAGLVAAIPAAADAATLRVRCERRISPTRSSISVDGNNLVPNAMYSARVISGTRQATTRPRTAIGDEVEFDFDSNLADIRAGATAIPRVFINNGRVRAAIFNASGQTVAGPLAVACRVR